MANYIILIYDTIDTLSKEMSKNTKKNIVLDCKNTKISNKVLSKIDHIASNHKSLGKSFVLASKILSGKTDLELVIVPTIIEAQDIIDLEDIERDLGL